MTITADRGFSVIETLVAMTMVALGVTGLTQLVTMSARANRESRLTTLASVVAGERMEQLRGAAGALNVSTVDSLSRNVDGWCDFLDEHGRLMGRGTSPPRGATFVRRWSVREVTTAATGAWLLQVVVVPRIVGRWSGVRLVSVSAREVG